MACAPEETARRWRWRAPGVASAACAAAALAVAVLCCAGGADAHGRLIEPPSRASMWRYGFSTPPDYNDHELYCGGFSRQWRRNGGKCGVCGDPWDMPKPRPHESGGVFGQGPVVRRWRMGSAVPIRVELTANHRGYFEFRLCPRDTASPEATQECLDAHRLRRAASGRSANALGAQAQALRRTASAVPGPLPPDDDEENDVEDDAAARYYPEPGANRVFEMRYQLPQGLVCERCVLQWRYIAGNSWGRCANGTEAVGCGPQEEFRACADVAVDGKGERPTPFPDRTRTTSRPSAPSDEEEGDYEESDGEDEGEAPGVAEERLGRALWTALATALGAALAAATALLLLYVYYYHAADVLKRWLQKNRARANAGAGA